MNRFADQRTFTDLLAVFELNRKEGSKKYREGMAENADPVRALAEATAGAQQLTNAVVVQMLVLLVEKEI